MQSEEQGEERGGDGVRGPARGEEGGGDAARPPARFLEPAIFVLLLTCGVANRQAVVSGLNAAY